MSEAASTGAASIGHASIGAASIGHDLTAIDPAAWDAVQSPRGFYASTPWLRHAHATANPAPWYATVAGSAGLLAALPAYPLTARSPYLFCRTDKVLEEIHRVAWTGDLMPTLACGGRNPAHTGVGVAPGVEPGPVLATVVAEVEARSRAAGLRSMAFLYVDEDDTALREVLDHSGYASTRSDTAYVLDVPESFAAYLMGHRHGRRNTIRREQRTLAAAGVTYRTEPLTDELADLVAPLELALYARHGTRPDAAAFRTVLRSIARHCAGIAYVVTAHLDGRLAGFVLVFRWRGEVYARQVGFDYPLVGRLPVYFGLVYYELIRLAAGWGARRIHYSTGSGEAKQLRGCRGVGQWAYVKAFDPATHARLVALTGSQT